jgi:CRISPR/Cas system CMR subunit Cmr4 (Cas7 group RAMP superfamily)
MEIKYKIELLSDWHVGSGLDSGTDADAIVLKDECDLPYIPGKTIKGLLKDSLMEIVNFQKVIELTDIVQIFGFSIENKHSDAGNAFFSNAELVQQEQKEIITNELSVQLYKNIASTRIRENGVAQQNSLRTMEVCIPITLFGTIEVENPNAKTIFDYAFKWTRHLGVNRNRGLGRCNFSLIS